MAYKLITAPTVEPITVSELKSHCRIDASDEDTILATYITAARMQAENYLEIALISQTWDLYLDGFPEAFVLRSPVVSVSSVNYYDQSGALLTLSSDAYLVDSASMPCYITPAYGTTWPTPRAIPNAVWVRHVAGYGATAASVPQSIRHWILMRAASMYLHREDATVLPRGKVEKLAFVDSLLDPYRLVGA
jgi:uncharacterized phiE125 gp8 family phage protein